MPKRNEEVEKALRERFKDLYKPHHDERRGESYWNKIQDEEFEEPQANPDNIPSDVTPWMNPGWRQRQKRLEALSKAIENISLSKKAQLVLNMYLAGYDQKSIAKAVGTTQANISQQITRLAKKLKILMDGELS